MLYDFDFDRFQFGAIGKVKGLQIQCLCKRYALGLWRAQLKLAQLVHRVDYTVRPIAMGERKKKTSALNLKCIFLLSTGFARTQKIHF